MTSARVPQGQPNTSDHLGPSRISVEESLGLLPLSSAQLGVWFAQRLDPESPAFNISEYIEIRGRLDRAAFERALQNALEEAQALRVRIIERDGVPWQKIVDCSAWSLPFVDLSGEPDAADVALQLMRKDLARTVDLSGESLFSFVLFRLGDDHHFWYSRYHHIILDGYGMGLVARRVAANYNRITGGIADGGQCAGGLADIIREDTIYRSSDRFQRDKEFWSTHPSAGCENLSLARRAPVRQGSVLRATTSLDILEVRRLTSLADDLNVKF